MVACTPEQGTCRACGQPTEVIGYDQSEQLDVVPAKYFVVVSKREKRVCKHCAEGGVAQAHLLQFAGGDRCNSLILRVEIGPD
jgi:transposase